MLPTKSNLNRSVDARSLLRVTLLNCFASCILSGCILSGPLHAQSIDQSKGMIHQPPARSQRTSQKTTSAVPPANRVINQTPKSPTSSKTVATSPPLELPATRAADPASPHAAKPTLPRAVEPARPRPADARPVQKEDLAELANPEQANSVEPIFEFEPAPAMHAVAYRSTISIPSLEAPPGWHAVEKSMRDKLDTCDAMLRRGAIFSARQTCWKGLEELCQVLDLHDPNGRRVECLRRALVAMREEEDFYRFSDIQLAKPDVLSNLSFAHETPVIRTLLEQNGSSDTNINPLVAAQHYRSYARDQLVLACDRHPWGSDLLYALGKAFEKQAWEDRSRSALVHQHAELVYQAALETNPNQTLAATQLGYVLLQLDRPQEAQAILARSVQVAPSPTSLQNLAEAYRRLNNPSGVQWCVVQIDQLKRREQASQHDVPFTEIDARQFAAISPPDATYLQRNNGGAAHAASPNTTAHPYSQNRVAAQSIPQSSPESNGGKGWFPGLWR